MRVILHLLLWGGILTSSLWGQQAKPAPAAEKTLPPLAPFLEKHCAECHDADTMKGDFDITALKMDLTKTENFATWVKVFDRTSSGEMPPAKKPRPKADEAQAYLNGLAKQLVNFDNDRINRYGRSTQRRMNRFEYESTLRDLLQAPWLQIRESLPEDSEKYRFNKTGEALDVSHVQLGRYLAVADEALRAVVVPYLTKPEVTTKRYYARDQYAYIVPMFTNREFTGSVERGTFPTLGFEAQREVRLKQAPLTVGKDNPTQRALEGFGMVASTYEPLEPHFTASFIKNPGRYKVKICGHSIWVGPGSEGRWYVPNFDKVSKGRRPEPVTIYARGAHVLRRLANADLGVEPTTFEFEADLRLGETIQIDPVRFFRSRPGPNNKVWWQNPLAERDGQPGLVMRWIEITGPYYDSWPTASHKVLFGDLPFRQSPKGGLWVDIVSNNPEKDAEMLLRKFVKAAYRRPVSPQEEVRFLPVIKNALATGSSFGEAMIAGYTAVLCSPSFLYIDEKPGRLDDAAVATRLSYFLWNSSPDQTLRDLAAAGKLRQPNVLREQTERLLADNRSSRFTFAFLDYWLDLRNIAENSPDAKLYPEYYLDDHLAESATDESYAYFAELIRNNLPARYIVDSDFTFLNERLAKLYDLSSLNVKGATIRRVTLPPGSIRGGFLTQAAILKVTANGTTTSPVKRGAWVMERILGRKPPPPPSSVPAVEPDIRGATTIREQLASHRAQPACAGCHTKIDPAGFALESFDVFGGYRTKYRAIDGETAEPGFGKSGLPFFYYYALPVETQSELDGRKFKDIVEFKKMLAQNERVLARNFLNQLVVYATGAPVGFSDREKIERILDANAPTQYRIRNLIHSLVQSDIFLIK